MAWDIHSLFRDHSAAITGALRRRGASHEAAEDLTQDAFLRIMTLRGAALIGNPRAFLMTVARNLLIDAQRRDRLREVAGQPPGALEAVADPAPGPEAVLLRQQRLRLTARAIAELPPRTRMAFEMHRLQGMTIAEVARAQDISTTRAWALIHEAYRHIRDRLRDA